MGRIELEAFYPYPIEEVWKALTEADALAQWLMLNEGFEPLIGKKFKFRAKPVMGWKGIAYCEILKVERPVSSLGVSEEKKIARIPSSLHGRFEKRPRAPVSNCSMKDSMASKAS